METYRVKHGTQNLKTTGGTQMNKTNTFTVGIVSFASIIAGLVISVAIVAIV